MCVAIDDGCSPQIERARLNGMRASECLRTYIGPHLQATYIHYTFTITRTTAINTAIPWILFYAYNVLVCRRVLPPRVAEIYGVRSAHGAKVGGDDGAGADGKRASSVSVVVAVVVAIVRMGARVHCTRAIVNINTNTTIVGRTGTENTLCS